MLQRSSGVPNRYGPSEADFHNALIAGLSRVQLNVGQRALASAMGRSTKAVQNIFGGSVPDAQAIFDVLLLDPTALDEVLAAYGFRLEPLETMAADDLALASDLTSVTGDLIRSRGHRSPRDTLELADKLRPIIAEEEAIVREADHLKGLN